MNRSLIALVAVGSSLVSCAKQVAPPVTPPAEAPAPPGPFAAKSALPYELPPFDKITDADFAPAFEAAMAEQRAEVAAITANAEPATFENTVVALERSGSALDRVSAVFFNLSSSNTNDTLQALQTDLAPKLAAHEDAIVLDAALFARIDQVYQQRAAMTLDPESAQLLERAHQGFVRSGANLGEADKARLSEINARLSTLSTQFDQSVLHATQDGAVVVDDVARLKGLSDEQIGAAATAAADRGLTGKWVIPLVNTTTQPALAQLEDRALRQQIYDASIARGTGGPNDTTAVVSEAMKLRAERAKLLGYPTYAAYALVDQTAATPEAVNAMLAQLGPAAAARAKEEARAIQKVIDAEAKAHKTPKFELQPWDWAFYAEQVRKAKYAFDEAEVKPYFALDRVLVDGVFWSAHELYGISFEERHDLPVYQASVRVFEVSDADGSKIGLLMTDLFARDNKQGGAWMSTFVDQSTLLGHQPVVVVNLNVSTPAEGQPALLSFDEVTTLFHEFGHALHGLFSDVKYPSLSGTNTPPDFAEYPSQLNEMWAREPVVLANYAKHHETGAPMPQALFDKVIAASTFNQGYDTTEYLEAAMIDQAWHQVTADAIPAAADVPAFEAAALKRNGMDLAVVPPRYHTPYFSHVFNGGYAAGYYAYIWSEVLARDTGAWFHEHGGMSRANGDMVRAAVLSRGRTEEPGPMFEKFYGGPPVIEPLLTYRGLVVPKAN
ncbi:MAG: M3 family metallopeptidase [Myxococcota bacterium]